MSHGCCNDFTRAQLLRGAAAEAGRGLPAIEPGMPEPAGTGLTRRRFLSRSAGMALAVYGASKIPISAFDRGIAEAAQGDKVLISIFFEGGIDALSVLAPVTDSRYASLRPTLKQSPGDGPTFTEDTRLQWHPGAASLATLHGEGKVAAFPAIGYDHPDQSHFTSRHYYEVGELDIGQHAGWLGRYIDVVGDEENPLQGLSMDGTLSPMIATAPSARRTATMPMSSLWTARASALRCAANSSSASSAFVPLLRYTCEKFPDSTTTGFPLGAITVSGSSRPSRSARSMSGESGTGAGSSR